MLPCKNFAAHLFELELKLYSMVFTTQNITIKLLLLDIYKLFFTFIIAEDICAQCDVHAHCIHGKCRCRHGYHGDGYDCYKGMNLHSCFQ